MAKAYKITLIPRDFNARVYGGLRGVKGYPVAFKEFSDWEFFAYVDKDNRFYLAEKSTGVCVCLKGEKSLERCVQQGLRRLKGFGVESFGNEVKRILSVINGRMKA